MDSLLIDGTNKTPKIEFLTTGDLKMEGKSIPENCFEFYKPAIDWLIDLKNQPPNKITMAVKLEYINTSSSKTILNMFKILQDLTNQKQTEIEIKWFFDREDADLQEEGQNYKTCTKLPFTLIPY
jgi:hypothetical protein